MAEEKPYCSFLMVKMSRKGSSTVPQKHESWTTFLEIYITKFWVLFIIVQLMLLCCSTLGTSYLNHVIVTTERYFLSSSDRYTCKLQQWLGSSPYFFFVNCVRHGEGDYKRPDITCSIIFNTFA